jgi:type I restriction enzyme S subunit
MSREHHTYPEYKSSNVEWLGDIPTEWEMWKLFHAYELIGSGTTPPSGDDKWYGGNVPWITTGELREKKVTTTTKNVTEETLRQYPTLRKYPQGSIAIAMYGATIGRLALLGVEATTNQACCVLTDSKVVYNKYLYFWLQAFRQDIVNLASGGGQPNINQEVVSSLKISAPNIVDQKTIANFLDHETAKIDTLIVKQQQLIKLLKEKRQAVISHAATKGLNPNAPMRDSGVEWLGELPAHWEVSKFGYISSVVRGGSPRPAGDPALFNGDYSPWVTVAEITKDDDIYLRETETFLTKKGSEQCRAFTSGTLLLSNSGATLGVPAILKIDANANDGVVGFEKLLLDDEFSYYYLSSLTHDLRERVKQGSGQPNLNTDIIKNIAVPIPPQDEVKDIVAAIATTRKLYKSLEDKSLAAVNLMKERRTALISAAVTGKIDVRDWVAPEPRNKPAEEAHA